MTTGFPRIRRRIRPPAPDFTDIPEPVFPGRRPRRPQRPPITAVRGPGEVPEPEGFIFDFDLDEFVPATLEQVRERERLYERFPEIAPPGTPGKITPEEFEQLRVTEQAERERTFEAVFPEADIESLLRGMAITPEMAEPERQRAEQAQAEFIASIQEIGRTPDTEALLRQLGATEEQLEEFFPIEPPEELTSRAVLELEPEWENIRTGEVITQSERERRFPKGHEPELDEWALTAETGRNYFQVFKVFGEALTKLPKQIGASILQAIQGHEGASVVDKGWADRFIESANTDLEKFAQEVTEEYRGTRLPITLTDLATLPQSMAFSLTSMGAGLGAGVPIALLPVPGARVAAWASGTLASGAVAFNMSSYQIMQLYLEAKDEEMRASQGRGLTLTEETQLKRDFGTKAIKFGLWEAVPEAISNLAFAKLLTMPLGKMVGRSIAAKMITKLGGIYGEEFLTETITQKGQSNIEVEAGLREGRITWIEAFKEVAPQTFLLTTILGGLGQISISFVNRIKKSLKKEIGDSPIFDTLKENITEDVFAELEAESVIDFAKRFHEEERGAIGKPAVTLSLEEISTLETRIPLDLIRKDEPESLARLTEEIKREGITEPITIRVREDGSRIVWDGIHRLIVAQDLGLKNVPVQYIGEVAKLPAVEIPKAEAGMPEAGLQPSMIPEEVAAKEVFPKGKGEITQISMEDQLKLEQARRAVEEAPLEVRKAYEAQAEIEGLKVTLETDPVATARFKLGGKNVGLDAFISIKEQQFPETFTVKQAEALFPGGNFARFGQKGLPNYNKVPRDAALDDLTKRFGMTPDEIADRVMSIRQEKRKIKELESEIETRMTEKPLVPQTDLTTQEVAENWAITGRPKYNLKQINALVGFFADYINNPTNLTAWELTRELRRETRAGRVENLKARAQQLIVKEGISTEEAMNQAIRETMSGELPSTKTEYLEGLTVDLRDALFAKVYHVLKSEPFEMMSTTEALTNALLGKPIPREPGVRGGSAYTRLQRVFGEQPKVIKAIERAAKERKPLEDVVEGLYFEVGKPPLPIDQDMAEWLRQLQNVPFGQGILLGKPTDLQVKDLRTPAELEYAKRKLELGIQFAEGKITKDAFDIEVSLAYDKAHPPTPITKYDVPVDNAFKVKPMFSFMEQSTFNRVLKELLWLPLDIGNFLRANKASFDNSFLRQSKALAGGHPIAGWQAHTTAWQSMFSQKHTEAEWELITRDSDFQIYEEIRTATGHDPLRVPAFAGVKGTERWRTAEEFGFPTVERLIPRLTQKLPHVKYSERAFSAGTNKIVWSVWKQKLEWSRRYSEKIVSGQVKLKEGESFDIIQEMTDHQAMLGNMIQRANLRRFSGLAPAMNAFFFAARSKIGRFLAPTHLIGVTFRQGKVNFNPRIIKEAWRDFLLTNAEIGGFMFLGSWLGLWDLEDDPRNAEFMSARIGNTRIDPWAGQRQFVVLYSRLVTKTGISSVTGVEYDVNPQTAFLRFITNSLSPLAAAMLEFYTGRNFIGGLIDFTDKRYWVEKITPFAINDVWEAAEEDWRMGIAVTIPAIYGEGIQTYTGDWAENFAKLGLPKYLENTAYGITEPIYDVKDFWADTSSKFAGVDPATLTEEKGFPPYIRAIAEARIINEHLAILPNEKLHLMNADPSEGPTFADYYRMWREREKLVIKGDEEALEAFDKDERTRNAYLGNFSQRQFALLNQYHAITDTEEQKDFLKQHSELGVNPRQDWLRSHTKENGLLAAFGQADAYTQEAYDEARKLIKQFDFPDNAVEEYLPPENIAKTNFEYLETGEEFGWNSWETKLVLAQDDTYREWKGLDPIETPVRSLELKIKHRELFDQLDSLETDEERERLRDDNPQWVDDMRRIDAIENDGSDATIEAWVDRGKVIDEFGAGSSEAKVWLIDNGAVWDWAVKKELLTDDGGGWNFKVLRLNAKLRKQDEQYEALATTEEREAFLDANLRYDKDRRRRDALRIEGFPDNQIETYIDYYTNRALRKPDDWDDRLGWYEDDWWLIDNKEFYNKMLELKIWKEPRDFSKVPTRDVFELYQIYIGLPLGQTRRDYRAQNPELDEWLVTAKGLTPIGDRGDEEADFSRSEKLSRDIAEGLERIRKLRE